MILTIDEEVELVAERLFDILWRHEAIKDDLEMNEFKLLIRKDLKLQIENILKDYNEK